MAIPRFSQTTRALVQASKDGVISNKEATRIEAAVTKELGKSPTAKALSQMNDVFEKVESKGFVPGLSALQINLSNGFGAAAQLKTMLNSDTRDPRNAFTHDPKTPAQQTLSNTLLAIDRQSVRYDAKTGDVVVGFNREQLKKAVFGGQNASNQAMLKQAQAALSKLQPIIQRTIGAEVHVAPALVGKTV